MLKRLSAALTAAIVLLCTYQTAAARTGDTRRRADALTVLGLLEDADASLSRPARRDQGAELLFRLSGGSARPDTDGWFAGFRDVSRGAAAVNYAARRGWILGRPSGTFGADEALTANAWYAMVLRMLGYSEPEDFTVQDAAAFAWRMGFTGRQDTGALTCGDLYDAAYDLLRAPYKEGGETVLQRLVDLGVCTAAAVSALGLDETVYDAAAIAGRFRSAVVCLELFHSQEAFETGEPSANASGFFITPDGVAVTNYHSIHKAVRATARMDNGETYALEEVLWYDVDIDAAIVRIGRRRLDGSGTASAFQSLEAVERREIRAGDTVYAISNPLGLGLNVSSGIINAEGRQADGYALPCIVNSADISQGSSGGALMNVYGQVIGITSGVFTYGNNMYLAVPMDPVLVADWESAQGLSLAEVARREKDTTP